MKISELLEEYSAIPETKSGFLMTHGKCVYLYNNICCEAACRRVMLQADSTEILAEYTDELFICHSGAKLTVYRGGRRLLKVRELMILYEIPSVDGGLYGVFAYEKDKRLMDSHFTDGRIAELIDSLLIGENSTRSEISEEFKKLEEAVRTGEVSALNKIYINGKNIQNGGII